MAAPIEVILSGKDAGFTETLRKAADVVNAKNAEMINSLGAVGKAMDGTAATAKETGDAVSSSATKYSALSEAARQLAAVQTLVKAGQKDLSAALKAGEIDAVTAKAAQLQLSAAVKAAGAEYASAARAIANSAGQVVEGHGRMSVSSQMMMHSVRSAADSFAAGLPPMMIFAEQIGRVGEAAAYSGGALGVVGAFMATEWGTAVLAGVSVLSVLIPKLWEAGDASDKVKVSSFALHDAQSTLSGVFDMTTGKMKDQTGAALALAKAQIILAQATARKNLAEANGNIADSAKKQWSIGGGMGGGLSFSREAPITAQVESQFRNGVINASQAIDSLKRMRDAGRSSDDTFTQLSAAYANNAVETKNLKDLDEAYTSIVSGKLNPALMEAAKHHEKHHHGLTEAEKAAKRAAKAQEELTVAILKGNYAFDQRIAKMGDKTGSLATNMLGFSTPEKPTIADGLDDLAKNAAKITERQFGANSPLDRYIQDNDTKLLRDRVSQLTVNELESVRNGIDDALSSALGVRDPFLKGLIDLFVQTNLIQPIARALQSAQGSGGGGGFFGTIFGGLGSIFGGGGGGGVSSIAGTVASNEAGFASFMPHFANGTTGAPGGWSLVGERGPEILKLPTGAQVVPTPRASSMISKMAMASRNDNAPVTVNLTMIASGNPKADRESAQQAASVLRRHMNGTVRRA